MTLTCAFRPSPNLLMLERISETLAGRAVYVTIWPLTRRERIGSGRAGIWRELLAAPSSDWKLVLAVPWWQVI